MGEFHGKGEVGFGEDFLTAFIPPGLGLSASWELVEAASQLGGVRGAPPKSVTEGVCGEPPPRSHHSGQGCFQGKCPRNQVQTGAVGSGPQPPRVGRL